MDYYLEVFSSSSRSKHYYGGFIEEVTEEANIIFRCTVTNMPASLGVRLCDFLNVHTERYFFKTLEELQGFVLIHLT